MDKKKYFRNEFVIDPDTDQDLIDYVRQLKANEDFSAFLRALLRQSKDGDKSAQTDVRLIAEIQDLRAMMLSFDERLTQLELVDRHEEEIKQLWREMARMNDRLDQQVMNSAVSDDDLPDPLSDPNAARQAALSAKLKGMHKQFDGLTH